MNESSKKLSNLSPEAKKALLAQLLQERAKGNEAREWLPISHNQKALWFLYRLAPQSAAYNLLYAARIRSDLDLGSLQRAIHTLAQRYPILTSTYSMHDGEPMQRLQKNRTLSLEERDASNWSRDDLTRQLYEESNRPIDLEQGPIMRIQLYKCSAEDYILGFIAHHIAVDFWALDILVDELYILYVAEKAGLSSPLPKPGPENTEYVHWHNTMLAGTEGEQHWAYWQQELSGELPVLNLPTDRPRPPVQTHKGASHSFALSDDMAKRLRLLANSEKVTLFTLMLAAYQALLCRYTNQEDLIVGTIALGRSRADFERVIGYLANPVIVHTGVAGNPTFKELLAQTRRAVISALEHQDFPFPLLVERLQPRRDPSYSPIYQTLFIWDRPRTRSNQDLVSLGLEELSQQIAQEGITLEPFVYGQQGAPFDLTLTIFESDGALTADFRYNIDLFEPATIARMEQHLQILLAGIVANPEQPLQELPLLTNQEQHQLLVEWNATKSEFPDHACLHQLIEAQVEQTPDNIALSFDGQTLTYRELNSEANQLAHILQAEGVGPDTLVGVCMERSLEMVVALLAVLKAGGAYVPIDPTYPQERLNYMIEDSHIPILLTQSHLQDQLPQNSTKVICIDHGWNANLTGNDKNPASAAQPDNLIYMIYTSGSTGKPKGVMNIHRAVCNRLHWMQQAYQLSNEDRVLQKTPFSFDVSVWEFFWPLLTGARLVVARPGGHQDPVYLASLIAIEKITTLHFVPSMLQAFLMEPDLEEKCASLKHVVLSGEALSLELQERFFARFPDPKVQLHNLYGPTEAAIDVTFWQCQRGSKQWSVPIGRPIANTQIYILNPAMQPTPIGVPGELYIGGVGLARGYHHRPELTAEKFIHDPFSGRDSVRLFKTGDLARYRADGAIEFLGRLDHQVKIRGFRIELGEIEAELSQHSAIKEVVVVTREDTPGNKRLAAYLVANPDAMHPSVEDLRAYLKEKLPSYMIPTVFMYLDAIPLNPNGKVDRKALPAPDTARPDLEVAYVAPSTFTEQRLVDIWTQVLGLDKVGIHDNYFDLGGASLQSLEIINKANEAGISLALEMLFEHQTIAELATTADAQKATQAQPNIPVEESAAESKWLAATATTPEASKQPRDDLGNMIIESLGTYLPPKIVSSDEVVKNCVKPLRFPLARLTGINNRRMAGETEFGLDISKKAVTDCLANSKYNPQDIDLLICCSISRCNAAGPQFTFEPSTSIQLKRHFGFTNAITFDVSNACTTLFTGMHIAEAFLKTGMIRRAMVLSGEYISHIALTAQKEIEDFMDSRLACLTVGDAGAALILERSPDTQVGFHEFEMYTVGRYSEACIGKATDREHGGAIMYTDAVQVSAVNMKQAISHAGYIIERAKWPHNSFQHILVHQTSKTTIQDVAKAFNRYFGAEVCSQENVIDNIAERGNTATTTHMIAIMDHIRSNRIQSGDNVIFGITGSGATIGTALYTFDDLPDRLRRREAGKYTPEKVQSEADKFTSRLPAAGRVRIESIGTIPEGVQVEKKTLELIRVATENCFAASHYNKRDTDLLIYSGIYRDEFICEPAIAALVEGMLGINDDIDNQQEKKTFALDIFNSGVATLNACHTAIAMIKADKGKNALIVASEIENNRDLQSEPLIGLEETGSAIFLDESPDGKTGFGNFAFKSFTDYMPALASHSVIRNGKTCLHIEIDPHLEDCYQQCIQETVQELLDLEQLDMSQINIILPPQISSDFITALSEILKVSREKFVDVQAQHDLFTSSLAYSLKHAQEQQMVKPGNIGLIINVGSGLQVGCAIYYF